MTVVDVVPAMVAQFNQTQDELSRLATTLLGDQAGLWDAATTMRSSVPIVDEVAAELRDLPAYLTGEGRWLGQTAEAFTVSNEHDAQEVDLVTADAVRQVQVLEWAALALETGTDTMRALQQSLSAVTDSIVRATPRPAPVDVADRSMRQIEQLNQEARMVANEIVSTVTGLLGAIAGELDDVQTNDATDIPTS